ncbi:Uncharacterized protein BM_BM9040 [Brugia malayi]|uniref:Uncharacterized protein n=1 Tax=Brugia malayi TaxID=6279 RepID=A0A4E9EY77_BRUMA|nr:Uncharacterized protein BM_BM9040 [Brugia malayi]VIO89279.1 Uncharacterized protein BM_BM9040 [Brugia malayi]
MWNLTTKNVLHAKRVAERKLRESMEKYDVEVTRSTEQTNNMEILKSTVQQLKLKLEEKERLCNDSKRRLTIHSRATSLAYRQIQETNNRAVKLLKESEKLHSQFVDVHSELINTQEVHNIIEAEMNQVKWQNTKHCEELQKTKELIEIEIASLIEIAEQNRISLAQKRDTIDMLICGNFGRKKRNRRAKIAKKDLEEAFDSNKAVLLSQHQSLEVCETNWKIQKQKISLIKLQQHGMVANQTALLKKQTQKLEKVVRHSIDRVVEFRNKIQISNQNTLHENILGKQIHNSAFLIAPSNDSQINDAELPGSSNQCDNQQTIPLDCGDSDADEKFPVSESFKQQKIRLAGTNGKAVIFRVCRFLKLLFLCK